jgi:poly(glycerol-phosphate) alpha-glucosyltransferase
MKMLVECLRANYDVIHLHGIWTYTSWIAYACALRGARVVVSPRGMLDPWILARSKGKKRIVGSIIEKRLLNKAHAVHALCESEKISISKYVPSSFIVTIPNAVTDMAASGYFFCQRKRHHDNVVERPLVLLFIGRIHEKKGVNLLIDAILHLRQGGIGPEKMVVHVYGWGEENYINKLLNIINENCLNDQVFMKGSVIGNEKIDAFANADAFILPSYSEGLPMAALEAASACLPMLLTQQCNVPEFFGNGGSMIDLDVYSISSAINDIFFRKSSEERYELGSRARSVFVEKFSWPTVIGNYMKIYE